MTDRHSTILSGIMFAILIGGVAYATNRETSKVTVSGSGNTISSGISAENLSDSPVTDAMITIDPVKTQIALGLIITAGSSTSLTASCEWSNNNSTWFPHQECEYDSAGNYDCVDQTFDFAFAASGTRYKTLLVPAYGFYTRCTFTGSGTGTISVVGAMTEF